MAEDTFQNTIFSPQAKLASNLTEERASGMSDLNNFFSGMEGAVNAVIDASASVEQGEMEAAAMLSMTLMTSFKLPQNVATQLAQKFVQKASDKSVDGAHAHDTHPAPEIEAASDELTLGWPPRRTREPAPN